MKPKDNNHRSAGVPRPYSSKTLPSPRNVLERIVSPFRLWEFLFLAVSGLTILLAAIAEYVGFPYNPLLAGISAAGCLVAVGACFRLDDSPSPTSTPSIKDISNVSRYYRAASRLSLYTIVGSFFSMLVLLVGHLAYPDTAISKATTLLVVGLLFVSLICSYIVVLTLCSYSSRVRSSFVTKIVEVSSVPEIVAVSGFALVPIAVFIAGSLWQARPIAVIRFPFSVVDGLAVMTVLMFLYVAAVSRF